MYVFDGDLYILDDVRSKFLSETIAILFFLWKEKTVQ